MTTTSATLRRTLAAALAATMVTGAAVTPANAQSTATQSTFYKTPDASSNLSTESSSEGSYQTFIAVSGQLLLIGGLIAAGIGLYNAGVAAGIVPPVMLPAA